MGADLWAVNDGMMDGYGPGIGSQPSGQINNREDLFFQLYFANIMLIVCLLKGSLSCFAFFKTSSCGVV